MKQYLILLSSAILLSACGGGGGGGGGGSPKVQYTTEVRELPNPEFATKLDKQGDLVTIGKDGQVTLSEVAKVDGDIRLHIKTPTGVKVVELHPATVFDQTLLQESNGSKVFYHHNLTEVGGISLVTYGGATPVAQVPKQGVATYTGDSRLFSRSNGITTFVPGTSKFTANFGNKTLAGTLDFSEHKAGKLNVSADISGNRFTSRANAETKLAGGFYGTKADSVAGVFSNPSRGMQGAFRADSLDVQALAPIKETILTEVKVPINSSGGSNSGSGNSGSGSHSSNCVGGRTWVDGHWRTTKRGKTWVKGHWRSC